MYILFAPQLPKECSKGVCSATPTSKMKQEGTFF